MREGVPNTCSATWQPAGPPQLAANMGTSVEMIEDFYGKKRVRDPKMATEITKTSGPAFAEVEP